MIINCHLFLIKILRNICFKAMDIIKVLARIKWGADYKVFLRLYRTLIPSKLVYGSIIYGSSRKSYIKMLATVHHTELRLALGAFRTSPVHKFTFFSLSSSTFTPIRSQTKVHQPIWNSHKTSLGEHEYQFGHFNIDTCVPNTTLEY